MANRRSLASLEKRIELTETKLRAAKARYDKLADELLNLKREKTARELKLSQRLELLVFTRSAARPRRAVDDRTSPRAAWPTMNYDAFGRDLGFGLGIRFRLRESESLEENKNARIIRHPVRVI